MSATHTRIPVYENPHYKKSGIKSYVWLLQKYGFKPTKEGPFYRQASIHSHQDGIHKKNLGLSSLYELHKNHHGHHESTGVTGKSTEAAAGSEATGGDDIASYILMKHLDAKGVTGKATSDDQQNDSLYLTPVTIGSSKQVMNLDFDTGSSDLWIWSTFLDQETLATGLKAGKNVFDPKASGSEEMAGSTWRISYGDGSFASGKVVTDSLQIGGITIENQAIECASALSPSFVSGSGDGLLGLAMGNINTVQPHRVQTPVENMITQKDITSPLFTAYLGSWRDTKEDDKGESFYTFGYIDEEVLKHSNVKSPYYTPLVNPESGFWMFSSPTFTLNGQSLPRTSNRAIADTGTTLALVDDLTCKAIYAKIPGARYDLRNQGFVFPTHTAEENLPSVGFAVGDEGQVFTCGKEDLLFAETEPGWTYGGIQSRGDLPFDILGDTWLKGIYAVFDQGNMRFGAVQRVEKFTNLAPPQ